MNPKFNIDRPKISDEEIKKNQNFSELVERFKQQSLQKARGDESWWKNKKIQYSTIIAGATVVCTITYLSLFSNQAQQQTAHETLTTTSKNITKPTTAAKKTACVNPPSQKLKTPYSTYKVNNAKGASITHTTQSKINIPKNSFVDKNGKDIVGEVTIEYREFHDMGDIIANGIPMAYDSAGTKYNLETAGMFDIKGSQNGEPVFIKPEKDLEVELASANSESRFNQYYLDTLEHNWKYIRKDHATPVKNSMDNKASQPSNQKNNAKLELLKQDIEHTIPKKLDSVQTVYAAHIKKLPKAKEPYKPVKYTPGKASFKLDGSYSDFPELSAFDNVIFEVGPENKNYSKEFHEITWSDIKVSQGPVKGKNYILHLIYRNRSEKLIVYPVLNDKDYTKAETAYLEQLDNYQALVEKRTNEEKRLVAEMQAKQAAYLAEQKKKQETLEREKAAMAAKYNVMEQNELASNFNAMSMKVKATRLFKIAQFGIFNSDCPHASPQDLSVSPLFVIQDKNKQIQPEFIYLVDHSQKTVYTLSPQNGYKLYYKPGTTYSICIFNKNKLFLCSKSSFQTTLENNSNTFTLVPLSENIDNLVDFKKAIEI